MKRVLFFTLLAFLIQSQFGQAQETDSWDNILYVGNKVGWGENEKYRHTAEFQSRYNNDFGSLEQWHIEYVFSYLYSKNIEVVPDFRFTRKPNRTEFRPGLGGIYKHLYEKAQLVHQVKWQWDKESSGYSSHGLRYAAFYNYVFTEKIVGTVAAGGLFEFGKDFSGFLGLRTGVAAAYVINKAHSINAGYFYGAINDGTGNYSNVGIFSFQLIININKEFKYLPAKYISF
jgi:hypothetical protein